MNAASQHQQPEESFVCLGDQEDEPPSSIAKFFTHTTTAAELAPSLFSFPPSESSALFDLPDFDSVFVASITSLIFFDIVVGVIPCKTIW